MNELKTPPFKFNGFKIESVRFNNIPGEYQESNIEFDVEGKLIKSDRIFHLHFYFRESVEIEGTKRERIVIETRSEFEFKNQISKVEIEDYFWANTIAIVFPYLRSYVTLLTLDSGGSPTTLPLLNLRGLSNILNEKTVEV